VGSELPDAVRELLLGLLARHGFGRPADVRYFLASEGDRPLATALLFLDAPGIYDVATPPQARGRGIGTAITSAALRAAREVGHTLGVLQASPMGYSVYRRMGFREHCRFHLYFGYHPAHE
jgi:GNAT superfamily N-acetyltransferase